MSKTVTITCDQCEADLTWTSNCEDWRLTLCNEGMPSRGGVVTAMAKYPAIPYTHHFCGIPCLAMWLADKNPMAVQQYEKMMRHRQWLDERMKPAPPEPADAS